MLKENVQQALNAQINAEMYSAYLYLAMAAHFDAANFTGFGRWMRAQSREESAHAMKLFDYVCERGGRVTLEAIARPQGDFGKPLDVFKQALAHEQHVSASIHDLYALAAREQDHPTAIMLQWFVTEQVEEEAHVGGIVAQLEMVGDHPASLLVMDRQLAARGA
jgi:ferritin